MNTLFIILSLTVAISFVCSLLEAVLLSTTTPDVEKLKHDFPLWGNRLEKLTIDIEQTSSAVLSLNTIVHTLGASYAGGLIYEQYGQHNLIIFSTFMTIGILFFCEILPKNIGVLFKSDLLKVATQLMYYLNIFMLPLSLLCKKTIQFLLPDRKRLSPSEQEILLLTEKAAKEGSVSKEGSIIISNAIKLDNVILSEIMIPRPVLAAIDKNLNIGHILNNPNLLKFARLPVYDTTIDNVIGIIRRRDIINKPHPTSVTKLMLPPFFLPESASIAHALRHMLTKHEKFAVTLDEFGSTTGIITIEDILEYTIGSQIFERDDDIINMREYARQKKSKKNTNSTN